MKEGNGALIHKIQRDIMKTIKALVLISILTIVTSTNASAAYKWTDGGNAYGPGIGVNLVYPEWNNHWVIFRTTDGKFYYYPWDSTSAEMTGNAKVVLSMLLAAMTSGQNVSFYYDDAAPGSYISISHVNVHP
jgi:hypothetical protein